MVCSSAYSATSYADVFECLGRVHPKLISSSIGQPVMLVGSTGHVDDLQSSYDCSQHVFGSLWFYRWEPRDQQLEGEVVNLGCPGQLPQQHNYTHSS
jgi:hypothetical protein